MDRASGLRKRGSVQLTQVRRAVVAFECIICTTGKILSADSEHWSSLDTKGYGEFEYDVDAELARYKVLAARLKPFVVDNVNFIYSALESNKRILVEGANAADA